jgi:hypothetical protein
MEATLGDVIASVGIRSGGRMCGSAGGTEEGQQLCLELHVGAARGDPTIRG